MTILEKIYLMLTEGFHAQFLDIKDRSDEHAGHAEAKKTGGGHYEMTIVSSAFEEKTLIERHRMIYEALQESFKGEIHALGIKAYTPKEWEKQESGS